MNDYLPESRFTDPTMVCPDPEHWSSMDSDSTELEVSIMVGGLIRAIQPEIVVETGTAFGQTAYYIGHALFLNGHGQLYSYETDEERVILARQRCYDTSAAFIIQQSSIAALTAWDGPPIDFAWLDSLFPLRPQELRLIAPHMSPLGVIGIHDAGHKYQPFRDQMIDIAISLGFNPIEFPTPRGLLLLGKTLWTP